MIAEQLTPQEITKQGLAVLIRELGPAKTWSFLRQFNPGSGDYTAARQNQPDDLTMEEVSKLLREASARPRS
jgi:hypothetical protein